MKYFYSIFAAIILFGCGKTDFSTYKSQFAISEPQTINTDSVDISSLTEITDQELLKKLLTPKFETPERVQEVINYHQFYFLAWLGQSQGLNKFSILHTEDESQCIRSAYMFTTREGEILDNKTISFDACLDMGIANANYARVNDSTFNVINYEHNWDSFLPTPFVDECVIQSDGKIVCNKREMGVGACIWDKLSIRDTPADKGKYLTSINLGERLNLLGKYEVDENSDKKNEYALVRLSDNSEGWVQRRLIGENAYPATITNETYIYKRADPLTRTKDKFFEFDIVAVSERDDSAEWYKVRGKPKSATWFKEGWIKEDNFSTADINIAYSVMAKKAIEADDYDQIIEVATSKDFSDVEVSLQRALNEYAGIENVREYSGDEIAGAVGQYFGTYANVMEMEDSFLRYNETCEQSTFRFEDGTVTHDMVMDSEDYKITSVDVVDFGAEVVIYMESTLSGEPAMLHIAKQYDVIVMYHDWYSGIEYYVYEDFMSDVDEDPEECNYDEEGI